MEPRLVLSSGGEGAAGREPVVPRELAVPAGTAHPPPGAFPSPSPRAGITRRSRHRGGREGLGMGFASPWRLKFTHVCEVKRRRVQRELGRWPRR